MRHRVESRVSDIEGGEKSEFLAKQKFVKNIEAHFISKETSEGAYTMGE